MLQIIYVISEENKLLLPYPLHLKNVAPLPCKNCANSSYFSFFQFFFTCMEYQFAIRTSCGTAASCSDMAEFQHSVVDDAVDQWRKDWKHVSVQKVVTLNICCDVACVTFHLPHITTVSFYSHQCQPTTGFFRTTNVWRNATEPSVR